MLTAVPRRPWETESTRADRQRRVLPFLALVAAALVVVALPPGEPDRFTGLSLALVGFAGCAGLIVLVPWERLPHWPRLAIVGLFCTNIAIVRHATGGGRSGFMIMLLLVIVWQAAYGSRAQVAISLIISTLTVTVPIVAIGGEMYPASEWRKVLLFTLVAAVVATVVHELVRRTTQERWVVGQIARLGRANRGSDDRAEACRLALELSGADMAVVLEPDGADVRIAASAGVEVPTTVLPAEVVPPAVRRAMATGEVQVIPDTEAPEARRRGVSKALGMRAWVHQPGIAPDGGATIDLAVGWRDPQRRLSGLAAFALPRLADEVATIVDRRRLVERLDTMTRQDHLTGLPNRRGWDDHLTREIARVARTGRPLSIAVLDLDRFKAFNDAHGHLLGDQVLKAAAGAWSAALRSSDLLARWGGEEFVVLMPETDTEDALGVVARMAEQTPMGQTFSAGVVTVTTAVEPDALVAAADRAVYRAKANGRDRVEVAEPPEAALGAEAPVPADQRSV